MISGKTLVEKSAADANDTETLNHLQTKVENLIETIRHVGIIVSDFQTESQDILYEKVDQIVDHLREIDDFKVSFAAASSHASSLILCWTKESAQYPSPGPDLGLY
eukprot:Sdes_comp9396_c0_seq1m858